MTIMAIIIAVVADRRDSNVVLEHLGEIVTPLDVPAISLLTTDAEAVR